MTLSKATKKERANNFVEFKSAYYGSQFNTKQLHMTRSQEYAVETFICYYFERMALGKKHMKNYELKELKITENEWAQIEVTIEVGRRNDEGTMAEVYCRQRAQVFIGMRGKFSWLDPKTLKFRNERNAIRTVDSLPMF